MILRTGSVLVPTSDKWAGARRFVVDHIETCGGFVRIIDKDGWWIGSHEVDEHYAIEEPVSAT